MNGPRQRAFVSGIVALAVVALLSIVPTPYYLLAPGSAVDLTTHVTVEGHAAPQRHLFLTDVALTHASALLLAARVFPGVRIVRRDAVIPAGETARSYDRVLYDAMGDSQNVAAIVAERAAGYAVPRPAQSVLVVGFLPASHAVGIVRPGDRLVRIAGEAIRTTGDVSHAVRDATRDAPIALEIERDGRALALAVAPLATANGPRLGVLVRERVARVPLPVPVRFAIGNITGSSAGLMFALAIYAQLTGKIGPGPAVAGTGTLDRDGHVGPIEGTLQKYIAARDAGAAIFLVPRSNYAEIAAQRGPRIVAVRTFDEALALLRRE